MILVSNDDGVASAGILALEAALAPLGRVYTVAPETEQSATSHAITLARPLRLRRIAATRFALDGTPVDCVYVALHHKGLLPERPALVVSGINHGLNLGSDVFYSGTVAAAREGALRGIPAIAVSLGGRGDRDVAGAIACEVARAVLAAKHARPVLLNVNVPAGRVRGLRTTKLGPRLYEEVVELRHDPRGRQYLWIGGPSVRHAQSRGTDTAAYDAGYASVTPLTIDLYHPPASPAAARLTTRADAAARAAGAFRARGNDATSSDGDAVAAPTRRTKGRIP